KQFVHESWTEDNGLLQSTVSGIVRTPDGYLWIGTQEGLARYNGFEFQVFDKSNTAAFAQDHKIETLFVDSGGSLWIGLADGLVVYAKGRFVDMKDRSDTPMKTVKAIVEDSNGRIWIGMARNGLLVMDKVTGKFVPSEFRFSTNENLNALLPDSDGSMWIGTNGGLVHLRNKLVKRYTTRDGLPVDVINTLFKDRQGTIWVGTKEGVVNVRLERIRPVPYDELKTINAQIFLEDANGSIWIGTNDSGLLRRTSIGIETFSTQQGLTHQSVTSLMEDQEGSLWIGTDGGGLNRLRAGKFTTYTEHEGLSDNMVWTVHEDHQGGIWVGTEEGGVTYISGSGEIVKTYTTDDGLSGNLISGISGEADGTIWLGTYGAGLNRLQNGKFTHFTTEDGLAHDAVSGVYQDRTGRIWIGTNGGVSLYENGAFNNITVDDGLVSNFVTVIQQDLDGAMWIGTYASGLNRITDEGIETYTTDDGLSHDNVFALHVDTENTIWIGTYGGGLTRFKDGRFSTFSMQDGLFNDYIYQILESDDGYLWMTCNKGIFRVNKDKLNAFMAGEDVTVKSEVFNRLDGLKGNEMNGGFQPAGWKGADGRMWFPSIAGIVMFNPMDLPRNEVVPIVHIESFVADGVFLSPTKFHDIKSGVNKIEFRFASLSYAAPDRIMYQYKLVGYDQDWELTSENSATYTNLDPKEYTFVVKASNNDGVWNLEGTKVSFSLEPRFYETWWFLVLCVFAGISFFVVLYRIRIAQLRKRHEELEQERDKARAANQFKSVILDNLSHEFRTPLTGILGYADILLAESSGDEREFAG
ncbi:MAG: hypothetical protein IIA50_05880, partial [Bacteroidetes bacterium]|nr:hypothetical protein [Bacteroidota bacterium]